MAKKPLPADDRPFNTPFAGLASLRDALPPGEPPKAVQTPPERPPARAVVRLERKGRRGKDVTIIEQLGLDESQLGAWLEQLKRSLGCGGAVEGDLLVLQGDQRERVAPLLEARGVKKISIG